jgi:hypothetical protein
LPYLSGGGSGVTDHGDLTGLADDDHPLYQDEDEVIAIANSIAAAEATAQIGTHNSDLAAHSYFLTQDEADALYDALGAADAALAAAQIYANDQDVAVIIEVEGYTDTAISTHAGDADAHGDFLTEAEADALYDALGAAAAALSDAADYTDAAVSAGIAGHEGAGDPHPGYLTPAEGNAAYAPIGEPVAAAHIVDTLDAHDASAVSVDDTGFAWLSFVTDAQGAFALTDQQFQNFADALNNHLTDAVDAHDASAVSVNSATLTGVGTDAQAVFEELDNLLDSHTHAGATPSYANAFKFS